jgi:uncharacterized membrane protein (UPF0127 family)
VIRRRSVLALATAAALLLAAGCNDEPRIFTVTPEPAIPTAVAGSATATAPVVATATPSTTPHVVVTASPDEPVTSTAYIPTDQLPRAVMTRADGDEFVLRIEVPERSEYVTGLSGRLELGARGMLFWYHEPTTQIFWMRNTHFDLAIAFVDEGGTILEILLMEAESLNTRRPDELYRYAIEAPVDWFEERGIGTGDRAVLDFEIPDWLRG